MRRSTKAWLIIAAFLILAGGIGIFAVMSQNHWDFSALRTSRMVERTVDLEEEFRNISIRCGADDIALLPSEDGSARIEILERENINHTVNVQGGTLSVGVRDKRDWFESLGIFTGRQKLTLYLPAGAYASLSIEGGTGDITIPEDFSFETVNLDVSTGDVECRASASRLLLVEGDTGDVILENISAGKLDLSVSTGRVELRSVSCGGDFYLSVSTGKSVLQDVTCQNLSTSGSTGSITLSNVIVKKLLSAKRSTGDVTFELCDAGELLIETETGDVTGSLLSDKVFITQTDTGKIEVPPTASGGKCTITTDTGDIRITIG